MERVRNWVYLLAKDTKQKRDRSKSRAKRNSNDDLKDNSIMSSVETRFNELEYAVNLRLKSYDSKITEMIY